MAASKVLIIEPRDPFIARDGKPFGVGVSAATLPFPYPSTTTGGVRTRAGLTGGSFIKSSGEPDRDLVATVKKISTSGTLLVELDEHGDVFDWLMPAPSDALLLEYNPDRKKAQIRQLVSLDCGTSKTDLGQLPHDTDDLVPVGLAQFEPNKPIGHAPRFWRWNHFKQWLLAPHNVPLAVSMNSLGIAGAAVEARTHVSLDPETWTAREGQLFQTRGLEFTLCNDRAIGSAKRLAMAMRVESDEPESETLIQQLKHGLSPLGGERRTVMWRESTQSLPREPALGEVVKAITEQKIKACRLVLLTPAYFTGGSRPTWLLSDRGNARVRLRALANPRAQVISGWEFDHYENKDDRTVRGRPKKSRRLMPAGSVLFLEFIQGDDSDIRTWIENVWMSCISDDATEGDVDQHRRDGFGLAAIGVWDGKLQRMTG